jgi:CRISPR-associated protein Csh1
MIIQYRSIGDLLIEEKGIENKQSPAYKRFILSQFCSELHEYKIGEDSYSRLLALNLDLASKQAKFRLEDELTNERADMIMLFWKPAPNDPNIFATTNALSSILGFSLWHTLDEKDMKSINWSRPDKAADFKEFLNQIRDDFFIKIETGFLLNRECLEPEQREGFPDVSDDELFPPGLKSSDYNKILKKQLDNYHKNGLKGLYAEKQGFALYVDGKPLLEGEYGPEYLDYLYFRIVESRYAKGVKGICHICANDGIVGSEVSLKQKFYGTTNPLYFDGASKSKTYTSFGICQDCDNQLLVGMSHALVKLKFWIMNLDCIIIPNVNKQTGMVERAELEAIVRSLGRAQNRKQTISNDVSTLKNLSKRCPGFNLLFFFRMKQEFKIIDLIRDLSFADLAQKTEALENMTYETEIYKIGEYWDLSVEKLRHLILPSVKSKKKDDYNPVSKQITQLVSRYLKGQDFHYQELIRSFVNIWSQVEYSSKDTYWEHDLAPFMMGIYFKHLHDFNMLKGVMAMQNQHPTSAQLDPKNHEKYLEYFQNHAFVFQDAANSRFYRGLFLLGVLIARIENAEYQKTKKKTFSNRLNFKGISPRKIKSIYNTVEEYLKIRDVWTDNLALAYCSESLLGMEESGIMPQEVVYYLLAGRAFENYLGIMFSKTKQEEKESEEDKND